MIDDPMPAPLEAQLTSARLTLRPPVMADAPALAALANDRQLAEMTARIPHPYGIEDARSYIRDHGDEIIFALVADGGTRFIGICGLKPDGGPRRLELGYWVGAPFRGKGYATEAAQAVIDHAFGTLDQDCVTVRCRVVNEASRRVIRKCGFHFVGTGMFRSATAGGVACECYQLDRRSWQALKSWGGQ
ncbi:GNAT family N-acetyltransferase [Mangrovicella endophytica]|uniref:GNAT family N-acetyltransferase n=1 Tax=Mangrovicella endophytica TaxID=2066697 RepID=UPI001FE0345F|nr:GNAT family N-acetyltransferase [Mangrovicella endophytica]